MQNIDNKPCTCGSSRIFSVCCGKFLSEKKIPETAEELMRSRYSSYVLKNKDYILKTWHFSTRPKKFNLDINIQWLSLQIINSSLGGIEDIKGTVYFEAAYKFQNNIYIIRENSHFVKEKGIWLYLHGDQSKMIIS